LKQLKQAARRLHEFNGFGVEQEPWKSVRVALVSRVVAERRDGHRAHEAVDTHAPLEAIQRFADAKGMTIVRSFIEQHQFGYRQVWLNLPPARARYCQKHVKA
jgi:hypothetical protein